MEIEQELREALRACGPGPGMRAIVMARLSAAARSAKVARHPWRPIVLGAILVAATAAAVLSMNPNRAPSPSPIATSSGVDAQLVPAVSEPRTSSPLPVAEPVGKAAGNAQEAGEAIAPPARSHFTVLVLPLLFETEDPVLRGMSQECYAGLLAELRKVPELLLVAAGVLQGTEPGPIFRLTVTGSDGARQYPNSAAQHWGVTLKS